MYEQDIELARLLLTKLEELSASGEELRAQLEQTEAELSEQQRQRDDRAEYFDVLSRAAQLLEREDLRVESPETDALEERAASLRGELGDLDNEVTEYRRLADELRQRAPTLMAAASGEDQPPEVDRPAAPEGDAEGNPVDIDEQYAELSLAEPELEEEAGDAQVEEEAEPESAEDEPAAAQPADLHSLFDIKNLKVKEAFTFGQGATYIMDATSVLDRVPHYDMHYRALHESEVRDELLLDIERLSSEISGRFVVVFNSPHEPASELGPSVEVRYAGDGDKLAADELITALARELVAVEKTACVVTGDSVLGELLEKEQAHVIPLGEFFIT